MPTFEQWRSAGDAFDHRGHAIFVQDAGAGVDDVLVCIHGFPTASWDWHAIWPQLTASFGRVLAPDMIGFGWSAKPRDYDYTINDQADLHEGLLRARGVSEFDVLAHDYGDTVAQELLARHADRERAGDRSLRIRSVVFLNGGLFPETHRPLRVQQLLAGRLGPLLAALTTERTFLRGLSAVFATDTAPSDAELHQFWQLFHHDNGNRNAHKLIRYMQERRDNRERWVGVLQETSVPLRVIDGGADPISGAHMVARYRELVADPDTVVFDDIGHYPQLEAPARTWKAIAKFHRRRAETDAS